MSDLSDLSETRRKLYRTITLDGLGDIMIGVASLALAGMFYFDSGVFIFVLVLITPTVIIARKKFVFPRIGYFSMEKSVERDTSPNLVIAFTTLAILAVALGTAKALGLSLPAVLEDNVLLIFGILVTASITLAGYYTGIKRNYVYAGIIMVFFIHAATQNYSVAEGPSTVLNALASYLTILGIVLVTVGLVLLVRFVRRYPIMQEDGHEI